MLINGKPLDEFVEEHEFQLHVDNHSRDRAMKAWHMERREDAASPGQSSVRNWMGTPRLGKYRPRSRQW